MKDGGDLIFARGLWGLPDGDVYQNCAAVAEDGFDWVEAYWDGLEPELPKAVEAAGLEWIAQVHTRKNWANQGEERLRRMLGEAVEYGAKLVNIHTGSDMLTPEENLIPIDLAAELSDELGIPVVHETHRGRATWSIPSTLELIQLRPDIRFCADLSHWTCVHESMLEGLEEKIEGVLARTLLVHARVGFPQGPQVPHWKSPFFEAETERFFSFWDRMVEHAKRENRRLVFCPEFGPVPYQAVHPETGEPLADNREVNRSMGEALRARYA